MHRNVIEFIAQKSILDEDHSKPLRSSTADWFVYIHRLLCTSDIPPRTENFANIAQLASCNAESLRHYLPIRAWIRR